MIMCSFLLLLLVVVVVVVEVVVVLLVEMRSKANRIQEKILDGIIQPNQINM